MQSDKRFLFFFLCPLSYFFYELCHTLNIISSPYLPLTHMPISKAQVAGHHELLVSGSESVVIFHLHNPPSLQNIYFLHHISSKFHFPKSQSKNLCLSTTEASHSVFQITTKESSSNHRTPTNITETII